MDPLRLRLWVRHWLVSRAYTLVLIVVLAGCCGEVLGSEDERDCARARWQLDPLQHPSLCQEVDLLPLCPDRLARWQTASMVEVLPAELDVRTLLSDERLQEAVRQASCWFRHNGYADCGYTACIVLDAFETMAWYGMTYELWISLIYEEPALANYENRWKKRSSSTILLCPSVVDVRFQRSESGALVWKGAPPRGEAGEPCQYKESRYGFVGR